MKYSTMLKIFRMTQEELLKYLTMRLNTFGYDVKATKDYVYGTVKTDSIPVMVVAHLDTVHYEKCKDVFYDKQKEVIWSPQGIGGDDRNGVIAILDILSSGLRPEVLFTTDEEVGGIGATVAGNEIKKPSVKYLMEFDRKGYDDAVFYDCENKKFKKYIQNFGFVESWGSFSDICMLSDAWDIASVNLSIGYYNAHTKQEYVVVTEIQDTVKKAIEMLLDANKCEFFDYQKKVVTYVPTNYTKGYATKPKQHKMSTFKKAESYSWWDDYLNSGTEITETKEAKPSTFIESDYCGYCGSYHHVDDMTFDYMENVHVCKGCARKYGF